MASVKNLSFVEQFVSGMNASLGVTSSGYSALSSSQVGNLVSAILNGTQTVSGMVGYCSEVGFLSEKVGVGTAKLGVYISAAQVVDAGVSYANNTSDQKALELLSSYLGFTSSVLAAQASMVAVGAIEGSILTLGLWAIGFGVAAYAFSEMSDKYQNDQEFATAIVDGIDATVTAFAEALDALEAKNPFFYEKCVSLISDISSGLGDFGDASDIPDAILQNIDRFILLPAYFYKDVLGSMNDLWASAVNWKPQHDPLALDLDGDGIETYGQDDSIIFDHSGGNLVNGTGWVKPDDGFLAYDRNGNGLIDNGSELFGIDTVMSNGRKANSGFQALKDFDTNNDGKIDSSDAIYASLRVWQDADSDAVTDTGELKTLADLNISSINVNPTGGTVNLGNGNTTSGTASYTRNDGSTGIAYNLDLAVNTYQREYKDDLPIPAALADLPNMAGTGRVRDLLQAAVRDDDLADLVDEFSAGTTRAEQMAVLENLVSAWADTSDMRTSVQDMQERRKPDSLYPNQPSIALLVYNIDGVQVTRPGSSVSYNSATGGSSATAYEQYMMSLNDQNPEYQAWLKKIAVLERFNGQTFVDAPTVTVTPTSVSTQDTNTTGGSGGGTSFSYPLNYVEIYISAARRDLLQASYDALLDSVYGALALQTRLKPYMDAIDVSVTANSLALDFSATNAMLLGYRATDSMNAYIDLVEVNRYAGRNLYLQGWTGAEILYDWLQQSLSTEVQAALSALGVSTTFGSQTGTKANEFLYGSSSGDTINAGDGSDVVSGRDGNDTINAGEGADIVFGGNGNDNVTLGNGDDLVFGGEGNDTLNGGDGNDVLYGDAGTDTLNGGNGNDTLEGGTGNDTLTGGAGSDIYRFGAGDGQDTLDLSGPNDTETIQFKAGVNVADIRLDRTGSVLKIVNTVTGDSITANTHFEVAAGGNAVYAAYQVDAIEFSDGTSWTVNDINTIYQTQHKTAADDVLLGFYWDEVHYMGNGNDTVSGLGGLDELHGEAGNDTLNGGDGNDVLYGDAGTDTLNGGNGNDTLEGGIGNDTLTGGAGSDIYRFGAGDGQDTLDLSGANDTETVQFKAGVNVADIRLDRTGSVLKIVNSVTGDSITANTHFEVAAGGNAVYAAYQVDAIGFADGTSWTVNDINTIYQTQHKTAADDVLLGFYWDEVHYMGNGNDTVSGLAGLDELHGEAGNDTLNGGDGNDVLYGDAGTDTLSGGNGNDTLEGGTGNDTLTGGAGSDIYRFGAGDGQDTLDLSGANDTETVQFKAGVNVADIRLDRSASSLKIVNTVTGDSVTASTHFEVAAGGSAGYASYQVDVIGFADGTTWTVNDINTIYQTQHKTAADDVLLGFYWDEVHYMGNGNDTVSGLAGNDELHGEDGSDTLNGGDGNDVLYGDAGTDTLNGGNGNDTLEGGIGNDTLTGGAGNDTYRFGAGSGADTVSDTDATAGNQDLILYDSGIAYDQLWFKHVGNNLEISVIGTSDKVTITSWYSGNTYHAEKIQMSDGHYLVDSKVEQLVQAMAGMTPPGAGQTTLTTDQHSQLDTVLTSSWAA